MITRKDLFAARDRRAPGSVPPTELDQRPAKQRREFARAEGGVKQARSRVAGEQGRLRGERMGNGSRMGAQV